MRYLKNGVLGGGLLISLCSMSLAEIKLPAFFSDRMVIQRETGANIWGWADAGQGVKVSFAGQTESAKADKDGNPIYREDGKLLKGENFKNPDLRKILFYKEN